MEQVAQDGLHHAVRLVADVDRFGKVLLGERFERGKENAPAFLPALHHLPAIVTLLVQELARALPVRLFAICGQEIGPARDEVTADVLDQDRQAIGMIVPAFDQVGKEGDIINAL